MRTWFRRVGSTRWLRTRWRRVGRWQWRAGLMRREWWIGARRDFAADVWIVGVFGFVVIFGRRA